MLVAEPPYRLCDAIMFYEYFILFGESELLAMMERVDRRAKLPPLPRRKKIWIAAMLLLSATAGCAPFDLTDPATGLPLATCYDGRLVSFCRVITPPGTSVVSGTGVISSIVSTVAPVATVLPAAELIK